jgi:hypothetical protein
MDPWYKIATPRKEVREGRSFNPDEFAIALEQVVRGTAPKDYSDPVEFFRRTCFTRALRDHAGMVLRRLQGKTENAAPVLTLITQFGGGKTHTLTTLYHIAKSGKSLYKNTETSDMLSRAELPTVENVKVAVFVGNAWDPRAGHETPWIDIARQLAGDAGVAELGTAAKTSSPGTETLGRIFQAAGGPVLVLFDEVLNFLNRHRDMADSFYAFIQNLTVAMTGATGRAAVISLPRSQVMEMSDWDVQWQKKISKVVRRVAKDLIANDETEISEVVRRRLFDDLGSERVRKNVAKAYADWCFERRAQLPPEWTAVDTTSTEAKAREFLRERFETCYPFHPATLSVFQRKWSVLSQYQQTRGTLAMLAQWISLAYREGFTHARREPLITLGSAPLEVPEFRSVVLGQLGESRLVTAIDADISGLQSHARALDADSKGVLSGIHRRVATAILFESSGGQKDKIAHLPELRFALGEPQMDTTSIDNAAYTVETKAFFIRKVGSDGFQIRHQPTLKKVVSDRRASLDEDTEVKPAMRNLAKTVFRQEATIPLIEFPEDGAAVQDSPKLTLVLMEPGMEWTGEEALRQQIADWTKYRGKSPRLYPGSLIWCLKKPGSDFRDKVEVWLAWKRVERETVDGTLGADLEAADRAEIGSKIKTVKGEAEEEVWAGYRFILIADGREPDGLKLIDLGAGHSSSGPSLCARILTALKSQSLLNDSIGAGYLDRNWPPALKESGAWPLTSLRQSFVNGSLTRLLDPDTTLRQKIAEFVENGEVGLASGQEPNGTYERMWFKETVPLEEIAFEPGVFLLKKDRAKALKGGGATKPQPTAPAETTPPTVGGETGATTTTVPVTTTTAAKSDTRTLRLRGTIPPEIWNRFGTKILPKLRSGKDLKVEISIDACFDLEVAQGVEHDIRQLLDDLGIAESMKLE